MKHTAVILSIVIIFVYVQVLRSEEMIFGKGASPFEYHEVLGWKNKAGFSGSFETKNFNVKIDINKDSMRDRHYPKQRTDKQRMLILGDSLAWGWGVEGNQIFTEILEDRYPDWEILNSSVAGYGTDQQLLYLQRYGYEFSPDVVLLLVNQNDFSNNVFQEQYSYFKPVFTSLDGELSVENIPVPKSTLMQKLFRIANRDIPRTRVTHWMGKSRHPVGHDGPMTIAILSSMSAYLRSQNFRLILVSAPMINADMRLLSSFARQAGIPYLHLKTRMYQPYKDFHFHNDSHWNSTGHLKTADTIECFLISEKIFEPTVEGRCH